MASMNDIENSAVIQNAKAAYDAAKAAGDTAGMAAAHAAANAYRESAGGYSHYYEEGAGTNYQVIYSGSSSFGSSGSSSSGSSAAKSGSSGSTAATQKTTIIDSTYNPEYYSDSFSEGKSLLSVGDDVLGYGLMAFIVVALVSRILR